MEFGKHSSSCAHDFEQQNEPEVSRTCAHGENRDWEAGADKNASMLAGFRCTGDGLQWFSLLIETRHERRVGGGGVRRHSVLEVLAEAINTPSASTLHWRSETPARPRSGWVFFCLCLNSFCIFYAYLAFFFPSSRGIYFYASVTSLIWFLMGHM